MNNATQQYSRHVSVPSDEGVHIDKEITINRPVSVVYSFWRKLDNLPRFLPHLKSVKIQDDLHSHWTVKPTTGKLLEWDAEIIEQRDNEMVSWRSAPGADLDNAGSVWFTPINGGSGTQVRVELKYVPPAGQFLEDVLGGDLEMDIEEGLNRLKSILETNEPEQETSAQRWERTAEALRKSAAATQTYIKANPWTAMTCALVSGLVLGVLLNSRRGPRVRAECD